MANVGSISRPESAVRPASLSWLPETFILFLALLGVFTLLRSHNLTAVDGAVRAFAVYHENQAQFHGSSHMLYPIYVLFWTRAAHFLGFSMADPISFVRVAQAMNCFFGAACAAILFAILRSLAISRWVALAGGLGWAFSRAVLLHATNSAEPLAGLFWSVVAFACVLYACRSSRMWPLPVAGLLLAVAMASYQTMVLIAIGCGILTLLWPWRGSWQFAASIKAALLLSVAFVAGVIVVYGIAFHMQQVRSFHAAWHVFLTSPDRGVFGGFSFSKAANIVTGWASNVLPCFPEGGGLRNMLTHHAVWVPWFVICAASVLGIYFGLLGKFVQNRPRVWDEWARIIVASLAVVATTFLLMCYWNSLYDKMWLQPLWLLFLTGAIFAERTRAEHPFATRSAAVLVIAMMAINLSMAIRAARGPWPDVDEATRVKDFIGSRDLVVTDWNAVSTIYQMMWAPNQTWDFVSDSGVYLSATPEVLRSKIIKTRQNGGTVYFLGLLDENRAAWDPMLGAKCGIPYDSLDQYRNGSTSVANFVSRGQTITLRRFDGQP